MGEPQWDAEAQGKQISDLKREFTALRRRLDPDDPANVERVARVLRKGVISVEEDARAILTAIAGADNG